MGGRRWLLGMRMELSARIAVDKSISPLYGKARMWGRAARKRGSAGGTPALPDCIPPPTMGMYIVRIRIYGIIGFSGFF